MTSLIANSTEFKAFIKEVCTLSQNPLTHSTVFLNQIENTGESLTYINDRSKLASFNDVTNSLQILPTFNFRLNI